MIKRVKTPAIIEKMFPSIIWNKDRNEKNLYLTFDDGPYEGISPFILDELKKYNAQATFFYLGSQIEKHPRLIRRCLKENHKIGNHTYSHLNGWSTKNSNYFEDIEKSNKLIKSELFRPPYGRIKPSQLKKLKQHYKVVMWDVFSWDFDKNTNSEKCFENILNNTKNGSILVLHENKNSAENVKQVLPKLLSHYSSLGYTFKTL